MSKKNRPSSAPACEALAQILNNSAEHYNSVALIRAVTCIIASAELGHPVDLPEEWEKQADGVIERAKTNEGVARSLIAGAELMLRVCENIQQAAIMEMLSGGGRQEAPSFEKMPSPSKVVN